MLTVRRSEERGHARHGWLDSRHTFSFADYYDPKHMSFRNLRVVNEDVVEPGAGFPTHGHRDMEIITYMVDGALEHKDSIGTGAVIGAHEVQRMTAGRGVQHSEFNHSRTEPVHLLQIWITPAKTGLTPSYEQRAFPAEEKRGRLRRLVAPDGADGALGIHQDASLYATVLEPGQRVEHRLATGRHAWVQVVRGDVTVNGTKLAAGDGAAISDEAVVELVAGTATEVLLFDLT